MWVDLLVRVVVVICFTQGRSTNRTPRSNFRPFRSIEDVIIWPFMADEQYSMKNKFEKVNFKAHQVLKVCKHWHSPCAMLCRRAAQLLPITWAVHKDMHMRQCFSTIVCICMMSCQLSDNCGSTNRNITTAVRLVTCKLGMASLRMNLLSEARCLQSNLGFSFCILHQPFEVTKEVHSP